MRRIPLRAALALGAALSLGWATEPVLAAGSAHSPAAAFDAALAAADAPAGLNGAVVIGAGGANVGYATRVVVITKGATLAAVNLDQVPHTVTSVARDAHGRPLFSASVAPTSTTTVPGVDKLPAGQYPFYCQFHPNMTGTLIVEGSGGGGGGGGGGAKPTFPSALRIPKVLTGSHITIPVREADVRILPTGPKTSMWTFGGSYPGPTIRRPTGKTTRITIVNKLPRTVGAITMHLHGDHHASAADGQPDRVLIAPGHRHTYTYKLRDGGRPERSAFDFYHDHRMGETGRNVWNGLQGMFITSDARERSLRLPKGKYDVPLDVADRSFDSLNQLTEPFPAPGSTAGPTSGINGPYAPPGDATVGSRVLVNGVFAPHLDVAAHRYRFRILNGSNFSSYTFHLSTDQVMTEIGDGSGLLPKPVQTRSILLGPAQRADVIVDFRHELHRQVVLESIARTDNRPGGIGTPTEPIMAFRITHTAVDRTRIPAHLEALPKLNVPAVPTMTWTFGLGGDAHRGLVWTVNGKPYDPTRADAYVARGSTQLWVLTNLSPITHYIHLHEEAWRTISRDGRAPPATESGPQDTWRLDPGETVEVAAKITDYLGSFMIHCHMLDHEDHGMMAQFVVVKPDDPRLHGGVAARPAALDHSAWWCTTHPHAGMSMPMPMSPPPVARREASSPWSSTGRRLGLVLGAAAALGAMSALYRRRTSLVAAIRLAAAPPRTAVARWLDRWRKDNSMRIRLAAAVSALLTLITGATVGTVASAAGHHASRVLLVCSGTQKCPKSHGAHVYRSIQLAVDHARNGDWILVWPGRYREAVEVDSSHGLTRDLHIRGLNRNGVVLDGRHQSGSGIHVSGVNDTWVENMSAQHYHVGSSNGFYWTGVDGFWGRYLTGYDNSDYGVYAYDSTSTGDVPSVLAYDYGSWNADSGIYVGGCRDCNTVVTNSKSEKNPLGYSGTNAGGELVLMNSEWDHNSAGIVPNTLQSEPDPPQSGVVIEHNYIHDNNDGDVPGTGIAGLAPIGYGVDLAGGWDNIVRNNLITNEKHGGVAMHWLFVPPVNNQVLNNRFRHVAPAGGPSDADIVFDASGVQNCASGNVDLTGGHRKPATTNPPDLAGLQQCDDSNPGRSNIGKGVYEPGNIVFDLEVLLNVAGITEKKHYNGPGPHPEALKNMPNPCANVPANPWCKHGKLVTRAPATPGG